MRRALHERGDLVSVTLGHPDVGQHDIGPFGLYPGDGLLPVADRDDLNVLVGERQLDHALDRHAVVGQEELM